MQKNLTLKLLPSEAANELLIKKNISGAEGVPVSAITGFQLLKRSIDARGKQPWVHVSLIAFINEPFRQRELMKFYFKDVSRADKRVIIIGAGPAGLFAALHLMEQGIKPVILERGKDVRARRRDLAVLNKQGIVDPDSNYCFGEGGAGTYSDGKLYTRSTKRGDLNRILNMLVHFGAAEEILYDSHPHIGTNKLPGIITSMRNKIRDSGGEIFFEKKVVDFVIKDGQITSVKTADGINFEGNSIILATGHSARDIFRLLYSKKVQLHFKPFALGVRVEHPQELIDVLQYHLSPSNPDRGLLPAASYSWIRQTPDKAVFSFCMCPGGIIAPSSTSPGEIVVNGWSPSKRNNPYANSGIVVPVEEQDIQPYKKMGALAGMYFQETVEQKAYKAGGGNLVAPAQRLTDFLQNKISGSLPGCSYLPGINSASLKDVLPSFIYKTLVSGFIETGKKMRGYVTNEALVVATESRTSSPIRIPRDEIGLHHPQITNLYPCGEGAGYAGGIVSAAMDGEKIARRIVHCFFNNAPGSNFSNQG